MASQEHTVYKSSSTNRQILDFINVTVKTLVSAFVYLHHLPLRYHITVVMIARQLLVSISGQLL